MLPIEEYEALLEDLEDLAVIAQRRDEPTVPLGVVVGAARREVATLRVEVTRSAHRDLDSRRDWRGTPAARGGGDPIVVTLCPLDDPVGATTILGEGDTSGLVTFTDLTDGSVLAKERDFWFAWYAFYPDTEIYALEGKRPPGADHAVPQRSSRDCRLTIHRGMHMTARRQDQATLWRKRLAIIVTALVVIAAVAFGAMNL